MCAETGLEMKFEKDDKEKHRMKNNVNLLKQAENRQMPVMLYGAGKYGRIALDNIKRQYPQIKIKCFIDDDLIRHNKDVDGMRVLSLDQALENFEGVIVISNYYVVETMRKLEKVRVDLKDVFFANEIMIEYVEKDKIYEKKAELSEVYGMLGDYESKLIYKAMVESRFTSNIDVLSRTCSNPQYFPVDIFNFSENEVFVDGGAYDGDTISHFMQITKGKFKYIYAFEPDSGNYRKLLVNHQNEKIKLFNMGLYSGMQDIKFLSGKGGSSQVTDSGEDSIRVCSFDDLRVSDRNVTFVKMDIEGSELHALQGMSKTISRCKPKLAICIYHKFEDLWEIPLFIKRLVPEYKLYIRNHKTYLDEIVLYATI